MDEAKVTGLLGLCVRARQATFGMDGCLKQVRSGQAALLTVDEEASAATLDKYRQACETHRVPLHILPAGLLHAATGRPGVAMTVANGGLAKQLSLILQAQEQQINPENHCGGASVE